MRGPANSLNFNCYCTRSMYSCQNSFCRGANSLFLPNYFLSGRQTVPSKLVFVGAPNLCSILGPNNEPSPTFQHQTIPFDTASNHSFLTSIKPSVPPKGLRLSIRLSLCPSLSRSICVSVGTFRTYLPRGFLLRSC